MVTLPSGIGKRVCFEAPGNINSSGACRNYCGVLAADCSGIWSNEATIQCALGSGPKLVLKDIVPKTNYREMRFLKRVGDYWNYDCGDALNGRMPFSVGYVGTQEDADRIALRVCREHLSSLAP
jgi:hypothetical protein